MRYLKGSIFGFFSLVFTPDDVVAQEMNPNGVWKTEKGQVEISDCGSQKCGKIHALNEPNDPETGKPKLDKHNEDASQQSRPILGVQNMAGFSKDGENSWSGGTIYNPSEGKTYNSKMHMKPGNNNTLYVSGCVLFFCKEQVWTRIR